MGGVRRREEGKRWTSAGGCDGERWIVRGSVQGRPPPEGFRIEHVDAGDIVRMAGIIVGQLDRPNGLELLQKMDERISL